ncbi:uncharacterized protein LOC142802661 [Rhipicephalus microplus]|uniref:uncharacterized protein LOC142802661 n=1 Tax=Rhipicephalus microplus TaxID=6941 RepID=UPI003F6A973D
MMLAVVSGDENAAVRPPVWTRRGNIASDYISVSYGLWLRHCWFVCPEKLLDFLAYEVGNRVLWMLILALTRSLFCLGATKATLRKISTSEDIKTPSLQTSDAVCPTVKFGCLQALLYERSPEGGDQMESVKDSTYSWEVPQK